MTDADTSALVNRLRAWHMALSKWATKFEQQWGLDSTELLQTIFRAATVLSALEAENVRLREALLRADLWICTMPDSERMTDFIRAALSRTETAG